MQLSSAVLLGVYLGTRPSVVFFLDKQKVRKQGDGNKADRCAGCLQVWAKPQPGKQGQLQNWKQLEEALGKGFGHQDHQGIMRNF